MIDAFKTHFPQGLDKWVVFGHWHTYDLRMAFGSGSNGEGKDSLWRNEKLKLIGLDNCTVLSHRIEMLVIED